MRRAHALLLLLVPAVAAAAGPGMKTIVVVRHAEAAPAPEGGDPPLSADGRARAEELARVLGDSGVRAVYQTHLARNRQTAEPLARRLGARQAVVDETGATLAAVAAEPWGATVLVVGHSNTVPQILAGLTGQPFPEHEAVGFDAMWIVSLSRDGGVSLVRLRYGAPVR
jgi:broad specificity phosphatase PhoE